MQIAPDSRLPHYPVLYQQTIANLHPRAGGAYIDGTLGAGGHAAGILEASAPDGRLLGLDVDPFALALAAEKLAPFGGRAVLRRASYVSLLAEMRAAGWESADGILLDLGASSMQFDDPARGFSFQAEGDLDMRFDPDEPVTAADLVNTLSERELADVLYTFGEERRSRQVAHAIVRSRPIRTTTELAAIVARATRSGKPGIHPATRTFQALRIAVNRELEGLETVLPDALAALAPGGRLAVISFHSLEDRLVKQFFRRESRDCICPAKQPICTCGHRALLREIIRRPIEADEEEIRLNPRSRSARLRVAEKVA